MNFDEFESRLRRQPRRVVPPQWRREVLGHLHRSEEVPIPWWRQLLWPHPAAWATLGAAWVVIFALNFAGPPEAAPYQTASQASPHMLVAYRERQRLWAELVAEGSPAPRTTVPAVDRPRSRLLRPEVAA